MKFAENNRISHRQLYRQMVLALTGPLLICMPGRISGLSGAIATGIGGLLLSACVFVLMRASSCFGDPVRFMGQIGGRAMGLFFLIYIVMTGGFLLNVLGKILPVWLMEGIPVRWLLLVVMAVCEVGTYRGIQRRGRMAEVSGGFFLGGILLMMALSLGQTKTEYFREILVGSQISGAGILKQTYRVFCGMAGISMVPFVGKEIQKRSSGGKTLVGGILTITGILMGMLLLLPAVLGWDRIREETYPVLPLMAGADLPGNVLARFDILWMGFLLYGILFALGSLCCYSHEILIKTHLGKGRWWAAALIYLLSLGNMEELYVPYLEYIFVPGVVLIYLGILLGGNRKFQRKAAIAGMLLLCLLVSGCAAIEPEKRMYPLALGIDSYEDGYKVSYGMPDLPQATGQEKPEEEKSASVLTFTGKNFGEIEELYNRSQEKYLDMGHLQVILLSDAAATGGQWEEALKWLKKQPAAGENIYVFQAEDPETILNWNKGGTTAGEYLKGLLENRLSKDKKEGVTLRQVYYQWYKEKSLVSLPRIFLENGELQAML